MTRFADLLTKAAGELRSAGIEQPMGDARALLCHACQIAPDRLTLHLQDVATEDMAVRFLALVDARKGHVPVSHLVGYRMFWGRRFRVTADVLDPRPETECLVAEALARPFQRVLDLGTGSGCILMSVLLERPQATGTGVDLSPAAMAIARENAEAHGLAGRVELLESNWYSGINGQFDLIVSNPPYIALDEMDGLSRDVRLHEPRLALTDEGDGLMAYRQIAAGAQKHLTSGGRLLVEIGPTQGPAVSDIFANAGLIVEKVVRDFDGRDRVVCAASQ